METGVNHLGFISSYSPIDDDDQAHYSAAPEYYGMLAFSLAGRGDLLPLDIDAPTGQVKAYAARQKEGGLVFTFINKGEMASVIQLHTGTGSANASVIRLQGPALDAKTGIKLGGAEVTSGGAWKTTHAELLTVHNGELKVPLPAAGAAIVSLLQSNS